MIMKQKKLCLGARFGLAVASFVLALLLFVAVIGTALIADVRTVTTQDSVREIVRVFIAAPTRVRTKVSLNGSNGSLHAVMPGSGIRFGLHRDDPASASGGLDLTAGLVDLLYEQLGAQEDMEVNFSKEEFTELVEQSTLKDYLADKTADLITDYLAGDTTTSIPHEEVVALIEENAEIIETVTGQPVPEDLPQQIASAVTQNQVVKVIEQQGLVGVIEMVTNPSAADPNTQPNPDSDENTDSIGGNNATDVLDKIDLSGASGALSSLARINEGVVTLRNITSTGNLILGIVICLVLIAAIILVNIRQIGKGLRRSGYPLMIAGLILLIPSLASVLITDLGKALAEVLAAISPNPTAMLPIVTLLQKVFVRMLPVHACVFGLGVALMVAGIVLGPILRKKTKTVVTVNATVETEELTAALEEVAPVEPDAVQESTQEVAEETAPATE